MTIAVHTGLISLSNADDDNLVASITIGDDDGIAIAQPVADADGICQSQTPGGAGNLTINGILTTAGVFTAAAAGTLRELTVTTAGDESAKNVEITYKIEAGGDDIVSDPIALPGSATTATLGIYAYSVSQIAIDAATAGAITIGVDKLDGRLAINGALASGNAYAVTNDAIRDIIVTTSSDLSLVDLTVTYKEESGGADQTYTGALPNNTTAILPITAYSISRMEVSDPIAADVKVGTTVDASSTVYLSGVGATAGVWTSADGTSKKLVATSGGNDTGTTLTITGYTTPDLHHLVVEELALSNAGAATSANHFYKVLSMSIDDVTVGTLKVGFTGTSSSVYQIITGKYDPNIGISVFVSGTIDYDLEHTKSDILSKDNNNNYVVDYEDYVWFTNADLDGATASNETQYSAPVSAIRLKVNSYSNGAKFSVDIFGDND